MSEKKKVSKPIIIAVAATVVAVIVIIAAASGGATTIDLADYMSIKGPDGYNGYATATVDFDYSGLEEYILSGEKSDEDIDEMDDEDFEENWERLELLEECLDGIEYELNKKENISNGDELEVLITFSSEGVKILKDEFGIKFKTSDIKLTVEGLAEAEVIDPFEFIDVTFSGVSGFAKASITVKEGLNIHRNGYIIKSDDNHITIEHSETEKSNIFYSASKDSDLKDGEKIVIKASIGYLKEGMMLASNEKEFTVSAQKAFSDKQQLADNIADIYALGKSYYDDFYDAESWSNVSCYYVTKSDSGAEYDNKVFGIYKSESTLFSTVYVDYIIVEFSNCYTNSEGILSAVKIAKLGSTDTKEEAEQFIENKAIDSNYYTYTKG